MRGATRELAILGRAAVDGLQIAGDQPLVYFALLDFAPASTCVHEDDGEREIGSGMFAGTRLFVDDVVLPPAELSYPDWICTLQGQEARLEVTVTDLVTGAEVTEGRDVHLLAETLDGPCEDPSTWSGGATP